jgi:hypothetical protein
MPSHREHRHGVGLTPLGTITALTSASRTRAGQPSCGQWGSRHSRWGRHQRASSQRRDHKFSRRRTALVRAAVTLERVVMAMAAAFG